MAFSGDNDVVDSVLYDVSGSTLAVTSSAVVASTQPMLLIAGLSGSTVKSLRLNTSGDVFVTGSVSASLVGVSAITGTVALERGGTTSVPFFVSGTVGVGGPLPVVSGPVPLNVTGSVLTFATGTQVVSGTVNLDRGNSTAFPLIISGTVGIGGPQLVTGSVTIAMPSGSYGGKVEGLYPHSGSNASNPIQMAGSDGNKALTLLVDSLGRIITAPAGSSTSVTSSLETGYITTAATTRVAVRATTYTEQTTNAQRSIVSANANDTSAGTGARTVTLTYFDQNLNGPYTETIALAGTTPVNTVATNICFIEDMRVATVGSGGSNAGIISLKAATAGGGVTICSIVAGDNRLFYAMHYVPSSQVTYITGISVSHNGTTVGSGGVFTVNAQAVLTANSADVQVSDYVRQYGQASNTGRTWGTAIKVPGPARIQVYVTPETSTSTVYRAALDLYDQ